MGVRQSFSFHAEYTNYAKEDRVVRFNSGMNLTVKPSDTGTELISENVDKFIITVKFRTTDIRSVSFSDNLPPRPLDRYIITKVKEQVTTRVSQLGLTEIYEVPFECTVKAFIFLTNQNNFCVESDILGMEVGLKEGSIERFNVAETKLFIRQFKDVEKETEEFKVDEDRTISGVKLIDRKSSIGSLWTNLFGNICQIKGVTNSKLPDGLYIMSGVNFERVSVHALDDLTEDFLKRNNLHFSRVDAMHHGISRSVQDELKEFQSLRYKHKDLIAKVDKLENDLRESKNQANAVKATHDFEIRELKQKQWSEIGGLNIKLNDLKAEKNALVEDNKQLRRECKEGLDIEREKNERAISKLKDNQKTNIILDVLKSLAALAGVCLTIFKFIKT